MKIAVIRRQLSHAKRAMFERGGQRHLWQLMRIMVGMCVYVHMSGYVRLYGQLVNTLEVLCNKKDKDMK